MTEEPARCWEASGPDELAREWGVPAVELFQQVGSTNDVARRLAAEGAAAGTVVLAERQLAGRGRAGRPWSSPAGLGLWISMVVRPPAQGGPGALPLLAGLAVAEALDPFLAPATAQLKWPNDLWVSGRKLGGILCEGAWGGRGLASAVVGVGLNVLHAEEDFPPELRGVATSVRMAAGRAPERREVAAAVVRGLARSLSGPMEMTAAQLDALRRRDALRGHSVVVTEPVTGEPLARGAVVGYAPDGALLLSSGDGPPRRVVSGTVRPAGGAP